MSDSFLLGQQAQKGGEVLQTKLEDLKTVIHETMSRNPEPEPATSEGAAQKVNLYLICDRVDFEVACELADYLFAEGCDVVLPATEGDAAQVYEDN